MKLRTKTCHISLDLDRHMGVRPDNDLAKKFGAGVLRVVSRANSPEEGEVMITGKI